MEKCIAAIHRWMINDRLLLNDDKTDVLLVETQYQLNMLETHTYASFTLGRLLDFILQLHVCMFFRPITNMTTPSWIDGKLRMRNLFQSTGRPISPQNK